MTEFKIGDKVKRVHNYHCIPESMMYMPIGEIGTVVDIGDNTLRIKRKNSETTVLNKIDFEVVTEMNSITYKSEQPKRKPMAGEIWRNKEFYFLFVEDYDGDLEAVNLRDSIRKPHTVGQLFYNNLDNLEFVSDNVTISWDENKCTS